MRLNHLTLFMSIAVLLAHGAGIFLNYYVRFPNFDMLVHLLGGMWVASSLVMFAKWHPKINFLDNNKLTNILAVTGITSFVAVCWEFFEFYLNLFAKLPPNTYTDTLSDLFFGILGSILSGLLIFIVLKNRDPK